MRIEFIDIINLLIKHLNSKYNKNLNIDKMDLSGNDKISDEEIKFNEEDLQFLMGEELNDGEESFLNFLKEKIMPNLREILDKFISMDNTNVSNKKKILYPLYEENACLYGCIFGILTKFKKIEDFIEYPRNIFNQYYNKDKERANIFDSVFQSYYSNKNEIEKEYYIKLPFKLFNIYLEYYSNLISEIITHKSFAIIMKYYLGLFFIGIFINKKRKNGIMTNEEKYCYKILDMIEHNKELLLKEKNNIKNEYIHNIFISDDNKQRISIYNLLLKLSDIYEQYKEKLKKEMNYYEFNNVLIGELLANLSIEFNIEKIDSELLFELINGPKTKYAIQQINKLSNYYNYINDKSKIYNQNEINIKLHILSKYIQPYLDTKLNSKFTLYLDDFINELSGEQILSSIVTIKFLNSVLNMDKIPNKFRNSLKKVYTTFIKKSANMCNILSLQNREGQIKEVFNDSEINEIILLYNKNKSHNIFQNMIELKRNIINSFVTEKPLKDLLSSNFLMNLIKYMNSNNDDITYRKNYMDYYSESIYNYVCLCNIMSKEQKISKMKNLIEALYDIILDINKNYNFIADIKSFYIFIFFFEKINSFINLALKIEDIENNSLYSSSFFNEIILSDKFIPKTVKILECFVSFMYNYIIYVIKGYKCKDKFCHTFLLKKINLTVKRNILYFMNNNFVSYNYSINGNNSDEVKFFVDKYINEKYGKDIMFKGYKIVDKIINNIRIYSKNDEVIMKKIDFIKYVNFEGYQFLIKNINYH